MNPSSLYLPSFEMRIVALWAQITLSMSRSVSTATGRFFILLNNIKSYLRKATNFIVWNLSEKKNSCSGWTWGWESRHSIWKLNKEMKMIFINTFYFCQLLKTQIFYRITFFQPLELQNCVKTFCRQPLEMNVYVYNVKN